MAAEIETAPPDYAPRQTVKSQAGQALTGTAPIPDRP